MRFLLGVFLTLSLGFLSTNAADNAFSLKEVKVVDQNTLSVSFSNALSDDVSLLDFTLSPKADENKEISLTGFTLSSPNEVKVDVVEMLKASTEYNLVVVFASDKDGTTIENGVDGMVTFKTPDTFPAEATPVSGELNLNSAGNTINSTDVPLNAASEEINTASGELEAAGDEIASDGAKTVEDTANDTKSLPETGPKEMMFVIFAMILGLGVMYVRRKA